MENFRSCLALPTYLSELVDALDFGLEEFLLLQIIIIVQADRNKEKEV